MQENASATADERHSVVADSLGDAGLISAAAVPVRDVRLAVTMVGGVALAVYECGVSEELWRMVQGQGMYGVIKRITQSHAYVDVLSGTSAGGINTITLAAAVTNRTSIEPARATWIVDADIDNLLQDPADRSAATVFRGNSFYLPVICACFKKLIPGGETAGCDPDGRIPPRPDPATYDSPLRSGADADLDLFVTGTFFRPQPSAFFDRQQKPVFTEDYAGVFHLRHRPGFGTRGESSFCPGMDEVGGDPLEEGGRSETSPVAQRFRNQDSRPGALVERLARIARTTSSLPAVFEPSEIRTEEMGGVIPLRENDGRNVPDYMFDGGFLNNRPLDLALNAVFQRTASREVARKVVFVEPSATALTQDKDGSTGAPNALDALLFYRDVPGRQTISAALDGLHVFNGRVSRVNEILGSLRRQAGPIGTPPRHGNGDPRRDARTWLCLYALRDELFDRWQKAAGLEGAEGLQREGFTEEAERKRAGKNERLHELVGAMFHEMCARSRDLGGGSVRDGSGLYDLEDIDIAAIMRAIERARVEIREFRFPRPETGGTARGVSAEAARQQVVQAIREDRSGCSDQKGSSPAGDPLRRVQEGVRDLNHLRDLADILLRNVVLVVASVVQCPPARELLDGPAPDEPGDAVKWRKERTDRVWSVLWDALGYLTSDKRRPDQAGSGATPLIPVVAGWETAEPDAARRSRSAEAEELNRILKARSDFLCDRMVGGGDLPADDWLPHWEEGLKAFGDQFLPDLNDPRDRFYPLAKKIGERLDRIGLDVALALRGALTARQQASAAGSGEAPPVPYFLWALEVLEAYDGAGGGAGSALSVEAGARAVKAALISLDCLLYPSERAVHLYQQSTGDRYRHTSQLPYLVPVDLVYISARSQQSGLSRRGEDDKLSGDALGHLGGFMKASWRANDVLFGRLDAAGGLADALIGADRLKRLLDEGGEDFAGKLRDVVAAYLRTGVEFSSKMGGDGPPDPPGEEVPVDAVGAVVWEEEGARVKRWFTGGDDALEGDTRELKAALLKRHQYDILARDLPEVLALSQREYQNAQRQGIAAATFPKPPSLPYRNGEEPLRPQDAEEVRKLVAFFTADKSTAPEDRYTLGEESVLGNIPPATNLRWTAQSLAVALGIGCRIADQANPVLRFPVTLVLTPLRLLSTVLLPFAKAMAGPPASRSLTLVVLTLSVVGIPAAVAWHGHWSTPAYVLLLILWACVDALFALAAVLRTGRLYIGKVCLIGGLVLAAAIFVTLRLMGGPAR